MRIKFKTVIWLAIPPVMVSNATSDGQQCHQHQQNLKTMNRKKAPLYMIFYIKFPLV
jgi:hypothetical protein